MEATFRIIKSGSNYIIRKAEKLNNYGGRNYKYFNGYDFMGSVNWEEAIEAVDVTLDWDGATKTMHDLMDAE